MQQGSISCIGKDGLSNQFYYNYSVSRGFPIEHRMTIYASPDYSDLEFFELTAKEIDENKLKIITIMKNSEALYGAKGIPDSAIPEMIKLSEKHVVSSSNNADMGGNEFRSDDATKMWKRLVACEKAKYESSIDRYEYI